MTPLILGELTLQLPEHYWSQIAWSACPYCLCRFGAYQDRAKAVRTRATHIERRHMGNSDVGDNHAIIRMDKLGELVGRYGKCTCTELVPCTDETDETIPDVCGLCQHLAHNQPCPAETPECPDWALVAA